MQGLAENIRFALASAGVKWQEEEIHTDEQWAGLKPNVGLDFPNLPYLEVDGFKMSESSAILHYVSKKFKPSLLGKTAEEEAKILEIINVLGDVRKEFFQAVYASDVKEKFQAFNSNQSASTKIGLIAKYLGDKKFLLGDEISLADICLSTFLFTLNKMYKSVGLHENSIFTNHPSLHFLYKRIYLEADGIKEYVASETWKKTPISPADYLSWVVNDMTID